MEQEFSNEEVISKQAAQKQTPDKQPAAKWDGTKIALAITAGVAVLALVGLLVWMVWSGMFKENKEEGVSSTPSATQAFDPSELTSYTGTDDEVVAALDEIVATVGDVKLTNEELQIHYWTQVYNFLGNYSSYLPYLGIDFSKPFDEQVYDAANKKSWADMFLDSALSTWSQMVALSELGKQDGFVLDDEALQRQDALIQKQYDNVKEFEFESLAAMLEAEMGKGATEAAYLSYLKMDFYCGEYFDNLVGINTPSLERLEEYYEENKAAFEEAGFGKEAGKLVDVRHVLIKPEGGTLNEDGRTYTYTDAQWEAGRVAAQAVYDSWLDGDKSEDSFSALAMKHSADRTASSGGLITNVFKGEMVAEFNDWIFDAQRKAGDYTMVKTVYGYHIIYFVDTEEAWIRYGNSVYTNEVISAKMAEMAEKLPLTTALDKVVLGNVNLSE